jgi:hypothetical protein
MQNEKLITNILIKYDITNKYGNEDIWDFTFNSRRKDVEFIYVRDFEKELVYAGKVISFSQSEKLREIVLKEVKIYNFSSEEIYAIPKIYLARKSDDITIEFPITDNPA